MEVTYTTTTMVKDGFTLQVTEINKQQVHGTAKGAVKTAYQVAVLLPSSQVVYVSPVANYKTALRKAEDFITNYDVYVYNADGTIHSGKFLKSKKYYVISETLEMVEV
jgi:hypothetical protein